MILSPFSQFSNPDILHFISTRDEGDQMESQTQLAKAVGISEDSMVFPTQTHGIRVKTVTEKGADFPDTDALVTNVAGICLLVRTADCVPLLFWDPVTKAIGVAHAGWKGTVDKIAVKTIQKMTEKFDSNPADILVGIGPSIGPEDYEVGFRIRKEVHKAFPKSQNFMKRNEKTEICLDLWSANRWQLENAGVLAKNIQNLEISTYSDDRFYSVRKDEDMGRFASGIMITE